MFTEFSLPKGKYGFPYDKLYAGIRAGETLVSDQGLRYQVNVGQSQFSFIDAQNPFYAMRAIISSPGEVFFQYQTVKDVNGSRDPHPEMYASEHVDNTFSYFEQRGVSIVSILDNWVSIGTSVNYQQYIQAKAELGNSFDAAKKTWSNRAWERNGFRLLSSNDIEEVKEVDQETGRRFTRVISLFRRVC